jgi:general secretion pathway protein G
MEVFMRNGKTNTVIREVSFTAASLSIRTSAGKARGFTLIELMIVLVVLAILASIVVPRYLDRVDEANETVLKQDLVGMRTAIDQFYRDKGKYPDSLNDLVTQRYIRAIPIDPITKSAVTWKLEPSKSSEKNVFDVRSGASGKAKDGSEYAKW